MSAKKPTTSKPKTKAKATPAKSATKPPKTTKVTKTAQKSKKKPRTTGQKILLVVIILILLALAVGLGAMFYFSCRNHDQSNVDRVEFPDPVYSVLTGEEISDASLNQQPTYCVQIPNGLDGARPQAGLDQAGIVFEAIAERGITRFAAIFQNPTTSAIGPIRSLRPYYLDWDLPFDCTIVHAGGSDEALVDLASKTERNLDENLEYMWREQNSERTWNNLFTSAQNLARYSADSGFTSSSPIAFARLTPSENADLRADSQTCASNDTTNCTPTYVSPTINFGANPDFNTVYTYNPETNTYARSYANGEPHLVYDCAPQISYADTLHECGEPIQLTPSVVVAMIVNESQMSDGYHESITTIGSGDAIIFQNGTVIEGTWHKDSASARLSFRDLSDHEIRLAPGQTWIAAVPQYGYVGY